MVEESKKNKQPRAVAVEYSAVDKLPVITAAGVGETARQILSIAKEHDIPIHSDGELEALLHEVKLGDVIDSRTFRLVAELISFLYSTNQEWRDSHEFLEPVLGDEEKD